MSRIRFILFLFFLFIVPVSSAQSESVNAGFVQGLWYSSENIIAGDTVRMYAAFRNNTPHDLTGTIRFTDNGKRIGSQSISVLSGRLIETWTDWTPTYGEHTVSVILSDGTLHVLGGNKIPIDVTEIVITDTRFADRDTDKDGIGDRTDTDDDNDGISDEDEEAQGTDPLVANEKPQEKDGDKAKNSNERNENENTKNKDVVVVRNGLERYFNDGVVDTLLGNVTDKVVRTKQSLDTYREERNAELYPGEEKSEKTELNTSTDTATITRTQMESENKNLLQSLIAGIVSIAQGMWTFVLFILSGALAYPALIQLVFLVLILYLFYHTARKLGRRRY